MATCRICKSPACDLESHKRATRLSNMDFDEVSLVTSGANQRAHVVLWKSDSLGDSGADDESVVKEDSIADAAAKLLLDSDPSLTRAQAVSQIYEARPDLYEAELGPGAVAKAADQFESERREMFVDVERLADQLQLSNRLTRAQAVAKALAMRQDIYDRAVLMASDSVPVQQESAR
jgi:hypothetical protein